MPTITRTTSPCSIEYLKEQANDEDATTLVFEHDCLTSANWQNAKVTQTRRASTFSSRTLDERKSNFNNRAIA
jgi:hypothetical protein